MYHTYNTYIEPSPLLGYTYPCSFFEVDACYKQVLYPRQGTTKFKQQKYLKKLPKYHKLSQNAASRDQKQKCYINQYTGQRWNIHFHKHFSNQHNIRLFNRKQCPECLLNVGSTATPAGKCYLDHNTWEEAALFPYTLSREQDMYNTS